MYPRLNTGGFLISQKAPQAKIFRGISYEKHNKNAFARGKTQQNVIFERFTNGKCAAGEKKSAKKWYFIEKMLFFCAPQAKNFWVKKWIFYKKAPHYKKAPPLLCTLGSKGGLS